MKRFLPTFMMLLLPIQALAKEKEVHFTPSDGIQAVFSTSMVGYAFLVLVLHMCLGEDKYREWAGVIFWCFYMLGLVVFFTFFYVPGGSSVFEIWEFIIGSFMSELITTLVFYRKIANEYR